jgi:hypothetical protein
MDIRNYANDARYDSFLFVKLKFQKRSELKFVS